MRKLILFSLILTLGIFSCNEDDSKATQDQEALILEAKFSEITEIAESISCEDSSRWTYTPYGSKACGGPMGYIAYSLDIDTSHFEQLIEEHKQAEADFNEKWGIISDCSIPESPTGVNCENGKVVLVYY